MSKMIINAEKRGSVFPPHNLSMSLKIYLCPFNNLL